MSLLGPTLATHAAGVHVEKVSLSVGLPGPQPEGGRACVAPEATLGLLCPGKQLLQKQAPVCWPVALLYLGSQQSSGKRAGTGPVVPPATTRPPQEPQPHGTHFAVTAGLPAELSSPHPTLTPTWTEGPAGSRRAFTLTVCSPPLFIFK